jgi:hypothetical protein
VQEVYTDRSPRLSIQGWYHAETAPAGAEMASVSQLKTVAAEILGPSTTLAGLAERVSLGDDGDPPDLTEAERTALSEWVTPTFLSAAELAKVRARFEEDSSVQLRDFLLPAPRDRIAEACIAADVADGLHVDGAAAYTAGLGGSGWTEVRCPSGWCIMPTASCHRSPV